MSLDTLREDLDRNIAQLPTSITSEAGNAAANECLDLIRTMWAYQEALFDELGEMDDEIVALIEKSDDVLQPATAALFATIIVGCRGAIRVLAGRLTKSDADRKIAAELAMLSQKCIDGEHKLNAITVAHAEPEAEPEAEVDEPDDATSEGAADAGE